MRMPRGENPTMNAKDVSEKPLTVQEAADHLGVSASLVYALCSKGRLRHARHGLGRGTIRIPPEALEEYLRGSEVKPDAPAGLRYITPR